jgi:FkbM family methyltransferase
MYFLNQNQKEFVKRKIKGSAFEKPFYGVKLWYDLAIMNKWGKNHTYDQQTKQLISKLDKNANCIDIGCHKGDILEAMIEFAPQGSHTAFEPIPELYDDLIKKFSNVTIHKKALSTKKGKTKFYNVVSGQGVSGLKKRDYDREHQIIEIDVEIDTLDNLIPNDLKIDLIKIDVEGGEFDVMLGGKELILKNKPIIVFEFEKEAAEKYNTTAEKVFDFVNDEAQMRIGLISNWLAGKKNENFTKKEFVRQFDTVENFYFIIYQD